MKLKISIFLHCGKAKQHKPVVAERRGSSEISRHKRQSTRRNSEQCAPVICIKLCNQHTTVHQSWNVDSTTSRGSHLTSLLFRNAKWCSQFPAMSHSESGSLNTSTMFFFFILLLLVINSFADSNSFITRQWFYVNLKSMQNICRKSNSDSQMQTLLLTCRSVLGD